MVPVVTLILIDVFFHMACANRNAIEQFAAATHKPFPKGIVDLNNNDTFIPKEEIMSEWTAMPVKNEDETFSLHFAYKLNAKPEQPKQWVQLRNWEIESIEGQSEHVVVDLKHKSDHVNILLHYLKHSFSLLYACMNSSQDAKPSIWMPILQNINLMHIGHLRDSTPSL